ncbi:hypothetical protein AB0911_38320 [Streptomyces nigra]|uniref:hypothetical protein n=1 Tax=Streptomyces nigra TaxID=1827580 RepID=UPI003451DA36
MEAEAYEEEYEEVHLEPHEVMTQGFVRGKVDLITIDAHKGLDFQRSQFISTTRNPELWFHG